MEIQSVMMGVIGLFMIMFIGIYAYKKQIITAEMNKGLSQLLLKITVPLLVISSFDFTYDSALKANVVKAFYLSLMTFVVCMGVSYLCLMPFKVKEKKILQFGNVFSNCGFIGYPVIESIYGAEGVIYAAVFNMFFSIFLWTYGVVLFRGHLTKKEYGHVLLSPGVVAVYIGLALMIFDVRLPQVILSPIKLVGSMTSPLSMLIVGAILAQASIKECVKRISLYYGSFLKLIVLPVVMLLVFKGIGEHSIVAQTMVVLTAMPAAAMTSIFAENFDYEKEYASVYVFFTTFFSLFTFPLILIGIST